MKFGHYSYDEYLHLIKSFHGRLAPGLVLGGFMVNLALKSLPDGDIFYAICETSDCLPTQCRSSPIVLSAMAGSLFSHLAALPLPFTKRAAEKVFAFASTWKKSNPAPN